MQVSNDKNLKKYIEEAKKDKSELIPLNVNDILGKSTKKKPNEGVLKALVDKPELVNKEHKFLIFLEKPTDSDRRENINLVAKIVHCTNGLVVGLKEDHNEMFDTMTLSWTDSVINHRLATIHPMAVVDKFHCVIASKRLA